MASSFKHDSSGFLVGELLDLNRELLDAQSAGNAVWRGIRSDVKAIARAVGAQVRKTQTQRSGEPGNGQPRASSGQFVRRVNQPAGRSGAATARGGSPAGAARATTGVAAISSREARTATVSPTGRNSRAQSVGVGRLGLDDANTRVIPAMGASAISSRETQTTTVRPAGRDGRGRFAQGGGDDAPDKANRNESGKLTNAIEKLGASLNSADQLDPTITAMKEIKEVVSPLGRGLFSMFGRGAERKKERWYSRILKALTAKKELNAVGGRSGGGLSLSVGGGMAGGLLGGAGGLLGGAGGLLGGMLGKGKGLLKGAGGLLKRVPFLGALLAGGGALASIFGEDDPSKSADENRTERYRGVGESGGMLAGGTIGAVLGSALGPVGTVVGGYLGAMAGEIIGGKVGEWTKTLVDADVPGMIGKAWSGFVVDAKAGWEKVVAGASEAWGFAKEKGKEALDAAKNAGNKANDGVKAATGVDVKALTKDGAAKAVEVGGKAIDAYKDAAIRTGDFVVENAPKLVPQTVKRAIGGAQQFFKPGDSKVIEERKAALANQMDAAGITDPVERAAFMAQMDHESGGFKHMQELGGSSYFKKYDGRKDLGNTLAGDGEQFKGRGFIQLTGRANYRDMGKKLGLNLENNPELAKDPEIAAKIATQFWTDRSRATKFGGGTIRELAKAGNIDAVTQGINGGMNGAQGRRELFSAYLKSTETVTAGAARVPPVSIPSSVPERIPPAPDAAIPAQLNTTKPAPVNVSMREPIGQDVGDRSIAHVVSGGLGMMA